jgi:hypothetical protein
MVGIYTINSYLVSGIIAFTIISDGFVYRVKFRNFRGFNEGGIAAFL